MIAAALTAATDLRRAGARFMIGGIRAQYGSGGEQALVYDGMRLKIRPRTSDFEVCRQVFRDRQYAVLAAGQHARIERMYLAILAAGETPVILDAGANIGASTIWFKRHFPLAALVAIEPDAENARLARLNLAGLEGVRLVEAAIGGRAGFVTVVPAEKAWAVTTERSETGCAMLDVAGALRLVENGRLFMVKVDIEGFEDDLFGANTDWLDKVCVVYIEPHDWLFPGRATSRNFQAEMGKRDFDLLIRGENLVYVRREEAAS